MFIVFVQTKTTQKKSLEADKTTIRLKKKKMKNKLSLNEIQW
jgi:hypothetical protein